MAVPDRPHEETLARCLFREANDAYFLFHPRDQRVLDVNPTAQRLTSFEHKELCGLQLNDLFSSVETKGLEELAKAFQGPHFFHSREGYFLHRKASPPLAVNVSVSCMPTDPEPLGLVVARDVQERERLVESLQLLKFSVDQSSISTFWVRQDARILHVNQAACRALGYSVEELLRLRAPDLDMNCRPEKWNRNWADLKARGTKTFVSQYKARNGRLFPVEVHLRFLEYVGEELAFAYVQDISERIRIESEHRLLEARVVQAQKLESLGVMAGGIAHDFNNRLTVILGNALLAQDTINPALPIAGHLQEILQAGKSAADLCHQLLAYTGKSSLLLGSVTVNALIEGLEQALPSALAAQAKFRYQLADPSPVIQADEAQLRQALVHLLKNAVEALPAVGGEVTLTTGTMPCERESLDNLWLGSGVPEGLCAFIEITDTGAGMDPATLAKMFEPFFSTKFIGRGLGLSFVFGIMRGHRGAIEVSSRLGKGTAFRLYFPAPPANPSEQSPALLAGTEAGPDSGTILVVEDEPAVRTLVQRVLAQQGYRCILAGDGAEAVQIFKTHHRAIDMVLLDLTMPRLGGEPTFHELRAIDPGVRVVVCTGYDAQQAANRLLVQGIYGVLQKPYTPTQLLDLVQTVLQARPAM